MSWLRERSRRSSCTNVRKMVAGMMPALSFEYVTGSRAFGLVNRYLNDVVADASENKSV